MTDPKGPPPGHRVAEIEEQRWVYAERFPGDGRREVSFDGGESWSENMAQAFRAARLAGKLVPEGGSEAPDELVAITQELLRRIRSLKPGEELLVRHAGSAIVVLRQEAVQAFRASALEDAGIEPFRESPGGAED